MSGTCQKHSQLSPVKERYLNQQQQGQQNYPISENKSINGNNQKTEGGHRINIQIGYSSSGSKWTEGASTIPPYQTGTSMKKFNETDNFQSSNNSGPLMFQNYLSAEGLPLKPQEVDQAKLRGEIEAREHELKLLAQMDYLIDLMKNLDQERCPGFDGQQKASELEKLQNDFQIVHEDMLNMSFSQNNQIDQRGEQNDVQQQPKQLNEYAQQDGTEERLAELIVQNREQQEQLSVLQKDLEEHIKNEEFLVKSEDQLKNEIQNLNQIQIQQAEKLAETETALQENLGKLQVSEANNAESQLKIEGLTSTIEEVNGELKNTQESLKQSQQLAEEQTNKLNQAEQTIQELETNRLVLEERIKNVEQADQLKQEKIQSLEEIIAELQEKLAQTEQNLQEQTNRADANELKISAQQTEIQNQSQEIHRLTDENNDQQQKIQELNDKIKILTEQNSSLEEIIKQLKENLEEKLKEIRSLQEDISSLNQQIIEKTSQIAGLTQDISEKSSEISNLSSVLAELQEQFQQQLIDITSKQKLINDQDTQINLQSQALAQQSQHINEQQNIIIELKENLTKLLQEQGVFKVNKKELEDQLQGLQQHIGAQDEYIKQQEEQLIRLKEQIQQQMDQLNALEDSLQKSQNENEGISRELKKQQDRSQEYARAHQQAEELSNNLKTQLEYQRNQNEITINQLKKEVVRLKTLSDELETSNGLLQEQLKETLKEQQSQKKEYDELVESLAEMENSFKQVQSDFEKARIMKQQAQQETELLSQQIHDQQSEQQLAMTIHELRQQLAIDGAERGDMQNNEQMNIQEEEEQQQQLHRKSSSLIRSQHSQHQLTSSAHSGHGKISGNKQYLEEQNGIDEENDDDCENCEMCMLERAMEQNEYLKEQLLIKEQEIIELKTNPNYLAKAYRNSAGRSPISNFARGQSYIEANDAAYLQRVLISPAGRSNGYNNNNAGQVSPQPFTLGSASKQSQQTLLQQQQQQQQQQQLQKQPLNSSNKDLLSSKTSTKAQDQTTLIRNQPSNKLTQQLHEVTGQGGSQLSQSQGQEPLKSQKNQQQLSGSSSPSGLPQVASLLQQPDQFQSYSVLQNEIEHLQTIFESKCKELDSWKRTYQQLNNQDQ